MNCLDCRRFGRKCQTCREEDALEAHKRLSSTLPVRTIEELTGDERKGNTVVTQDLLSKMRRMEADGMTRFDIAIQCGVAGATVSRRLGRKR